MELKKYLPVNATEYIDCFRKLAALINAALDYAEHKNNWVSEQDKEKTLARIARSVATIASLRGDSGAYYDSRPKGLNEYQNEMYAIEDQLRARLFSLATNTQLNSK